MLPRFSLFVAAVADVATVEPGATTGAGMAMIAVYIAIAAAVVGLAGVVGYWLSVKAKESKVWAVVNVAYVKLQAIVAHVEVAIRPNVRKALADGRITPEEGAALKAEAIKLFRDAAGTEIEDLKKYLNLGEGALAVFISGLLEKALSAFKADTAGPQPVTVVTSSPSAPR